MTSTRLPPCRHREQRLAPDRWTCQSPRLIIPARAVTATNCADCCCVDHPLDSMLDRDGAPRRREWTTEAQVAPDITVDEFMECLDTDAVMPSTWPWWRVAQIAHRQLLEVAARKDVVCPVDLHGRGIVIAAGGPTYFACAFVCVYVLRHLGCTLPIEFWHLGPNEIDEQMRRLVEPMGVVCRDAREVSPQPRRLKGWELKPFAILHSRFEQVLFLDADNVPAADPTYLFDDPAFLRHGAVFWPDLPKAISSTTWIPQVCWDVAGIEWRDEPPFESGQILIDKRTCWRELNLTMHLNEHSDFWYRYVYGDKDTFKLAWHKLNRRYALPARDASWEWPAIFQHDLQGRLVFTHACQGKKQLVAGERLAALPLCDTAAEAAHVLASLRRQPSVTPHVHTTV